VIASRNFFCSAVGLSLYVPHFVPKLLDALPPPISRGSVWYHSSAFFTVALQSALLA
jgi:hypothetical protein